MKRTNIYEYFAFGYNYKILRTDTEGKSVHGDDSLESFLDQFIRHLTELELRVTRNAAKKLFEVRERIKQLPADAVVGEALSEEVSGYCDSIDTTLDSELQLRSAFIVTPKRFDLNSLLDEPSNLLAVGAKEFLPVTCKFDFASACRSIVFGMSTAAAFHLMRCIEGALRHYYCLKVKNNRVTPLMWGPMVDHLRRRRVRPPKSLLDHLDNIRYNFRNPTQHPDARYVMDEAQDLLSLTIDALNRMQRDIKQSQADSTN